jgi:hypothetical protein
MLGMDDDVERFGEAAIHAGHSRLGILHQMIHSRLFFLSLLLFTTFLLFLFKLKT